MRNTLYDWERFKQQEYVESNYDEAFEADKIILEELAEFYAAAPAGGQHIEIGVGPNLYPLMAAAAYRDRLVVTDISVSNLDYIKTEIEIGFSGVWKRWHARHQQIHGDYDTDNEMVTRLHDICTYQQLSVLDLPGNIYDSCSMMFVAESMTTDFEEFSSALQRAVQCLKPGGSFAVALMLNSQGYTTGDVAFPAVAVGPNDIKPIINFEASDVSYREIDFSVREGHEGILLATGHRKQQDTPIQVNA